MSDSIGPKYPEIEVKLSGEDGNSFNIMGLVQKALKKAGIGQGEINKYLGEATEGNYDNLIAVTASWVTLL